MHEDILKKLERGLNRRSFLRGSGLAAAGFLGVAAASPLIVFAESQEKPRPDARKDPAADKGQDGQPEGDSGGTDKAPPPGKGSSDQDDDNPLTRTRLDADGNEYRECPQCGHNMYRQGRTWTCENCGYSYIE
jgi:rubredoxin